MLQTLSKIGEQLLEGKGMWARLTKEPKYDANKKNWVCPILFDCVKKEIHILKDEMELFEPKESAIKFRYVNPECWGRRGKKCALTVEPKNFSMLEETLFGKEESKDKGSMMRSVEDIPALKEKPIYNALNEINSLLQELRETLNLSEIKKELDLGANEEVIMFYSIILSEDLNHSKPIKLISLAGYNEFIIAKFGAEKGEQGIDQVTGNLSDDVVEATFQRGYNLNAVFQSTTNNFAANFQDFKKSFQIKNSTIDYLDKGSQYILNNFQTKIAGVPHLIIPSFRTKDLEEFDLDKIELYLNKSSDLLFDYKELDEGIDRSLPPVSLFWINYIAFESGGNSFKIMNHIKDVNSLYLIKLVETFVEVGQEFEDYLGGKYAFNLQSVYAIIPAKKDKKSKIDLNPALNLFKGVLEQQQISQEILFNHFIELTLCHWYKRYAAYKNINSKFKTFDFAIKDAVFKYSALIYALKQLNLLDMENKNTPQVEEQENSTSDYQQRIQAFFDKMEYTEAEKALFYLGRILSSVAYAQYKKGHESKPVLNKVNFNGMDADAIVRLSLDLREKTRQYRIHDKTEWNFSEFTSRFNEKNWPLSKEQNVFYLMAGYSFGLTKTDNN